MHFEGALQSASDVQPQPDAPEMHTLPFELSAQSLLLTQKTHAWVVVSQSVATSAEQSSFDAQPQCARVAIQAVPRWMFEAHSLLLEHPHTWVAVSQVVPNSPAQSSSSLHPHALLDKQTTP